MQCAVHPPLDTRRTRALGPVLGAASPYRPAVPETGACAVAPNSDRRAPDRALRVAHVGDITNAFGRHRPYAGRPRRDASGHRDTIDIGLVFRSPEGCRFKRRVSPEVLSAGRPRTGLTPLRFHDLRRTAVSLWIADGANPKQVSTMAGHSSVSVVVDRYGHHYPHQDGS